MISLLCPTRGRPDNVRRFARSAIDTATNPNKVELVFYVDQDDETPTLDVVDEVGGVVVIGQRIVLSECWNRCAAAANGEILGHMGDDIVFRSAGWDLKVAAAFEAHTDRICFVHGCDGVHDQRLGTHGFVHRRWVETVSYFVPPCYSSDWNDVHLTEVADALGRRIFLADVYTEHMHPSVGKAPIDRTHRERMARGSRDDVDRLYRENKWMRDRDIAALRGVMS